jgi:hypothetical protein
VCFTDLVKSSKWWFGFRLKPTFATAPAASKNEAYYKNGQKY